MATTVQKAIPDSNYAQEGFNRWLIPLAAVLVQICIGSVYAWSTFNRPINALFPPPAQDAWFAWFKAPYITFSAALVLLGLSAAFGGPWVERRGPRQNINPEDRVWPPLSRRSGDTSWMTVASPSTGRNHTSPLALRRLRGRSAARRACGCNSPRGLWRNTKRSCFSNCPSRAPDGAPTSACV